jgi:transcriptional pleiotropic repressor
MAEFNALAQIEVCRDILASSVCTGEAVRLMTERLGVGIDKNVVLANEKGIVTAIYNRAELAEIECGKRLDEIFAVDLDNMSGELDNVPVSELQPLSDLRRRLENYSASVFPIVIMGNRVGSLLVYGKGNEPLSEDIKAACINVACVAGLIIGAEALESKRDEARKREMVKAVTESLSYSEFVAAGYILEELSGDEGLVVASRIADEKGITRSVIVNAIRKLESAGVIESRSLGMKGTYIKVINEYFAKETAKFKK